MNNVYLDCSGLHDISLRSDLPGSIYIDGQEFINRLNETIREAATTFIKIGYKICLPNSEDICYEGYINKSEISELNGDGLLIMKSGRTYNLTDVSKTNLLKYF